MDEKFPPLHITPHNITKIVRTILSVHDDELGCDDCFDQVDIYAEMLLDGKAADEVMPMVKEHLQICNACREEFEAFLEALKGIEE